MKKDDLVFKIGLFIYAVSAYTSHMFITNSVLNIAMGFGVGFALVGLAKQVLDKKPSK